MGSTSDSTVSGGVPWSRKRSNRSAYCVGVGGDSSRGGS